MLNTNLIGEEHNNHLNWLLNSWQDKSPVCFLEGFSGTGKTTIARELLKEVINNKITGIMITAPETDKDPTDDILLDLAMELNSVGDKKLVEAIEKDIPLLDVLSKIVEKPILIVIDEFQRTMRNNRSVTSGAFAKTLSKLANRKWLKGRILLLTNRLVERARWSEPYAIRTLKTLSLNDGVKLLEYYANESEQLNDIPLEQRSKIVRLVGGNPRAIRLIIRNLAYESLEEMIGEERELWEVDDREVSHELVEKLEKYILEKTLEQLSNNFSLYLYYLSVIRKSFRKEAMMILFNNDLEVYAKFKREMIDRFIIEQYKSRFNLHPIVREIGLQKLVRMDMVKQANQQILPYYMRHFNAKRIVGWSILGGHFVEARYHAIKAEEQSSLQNIATKFQSYIFSNIDIQSQIPTNLEELDERIAVLSSLLDGVGGAKKLEFHLARLFVARDKRNDLGRALYHAYKAKSYYHTESWLLCSDILYKMERYQEAIDILKEGIQQIDVEKGAVALYAKCAQLQYDYGEQRKAIETLYQGFKHISPDKSLVSLYEKCARLLYQMGERNKAIDVLKKGILIIPKDKALVTLYTLCSNLLSQSGEVTEAIKIIKEGITRIPPDKALSDLYYRYGELLLQQGHNIDAISVLKNGIDLIPKDKGVTGMYVRCVELLLQNNQRENAFYLLSGGIEKIPSTKGVSILYLYSARFLLMDNQVDKAITILYKGIKLIPKNQHQILVELFLLVSAGQKNTKVIEELLGNEEIDIQYYHLGKILLYQILELWQESASYVDGIIKNGQKNPLILAIGSFSWLCAGQPSRALKYCSLDEEGFSKDFCQWLIAFSQLRLGKINEAKKCIVDTFGSTVFQNISEEVLLKIWDTPSNQLDKVDLAYYFPILPSIITNLNQTISRVVYTPSILDSYMTTKSISNLTIEEQKINRDEIEIFISHSSAQKADAENLHFMLSQSGYKPILDNYDILGGQNISERIEKLINKCEYFILLLTEESLKSRWVLTEITLAHSVGLIKQERLLPVQLQDIDESIVNTIPWIPKNLYNWLDGRNGLKIVVDWLKEKNNA